MLNRMIAVLWLGFMATTSAIFFIIALLIWLVTVLFDRRLRILHFFTCCWGALYVWIFPFWRLRIINRHLFDDKTTYVIVSNHQSQLDIIISFSLFKHFKWVSKAEVFLLPFIGWNMYLNRYIRLRRGQQDSVRRMYKDCIDTLKTGSSIFLFPEGTRSEDGRIKDFKPGAFSIAKRAGVGVLPIAIIGTHNALPKKSLNFHGRHDLCMVVMDPIDAATVQHSDVKELADIARRRIAAVVEQGDLEITSDTSS